MQTKIKVPLINNMSDKQFKLTDFVKDLAGKILESEKSKPEKITVYEDAEGVWNYDIPFCSHCNSRKVIKHDTVSRILYGENNVKKEVFIKRYKCKKCGRTFQVEFENYEPYSHFPKHIKEDIVESEESGRSSLRKLVKDQKTYKNFNISHETIRKYLKVDTPLYYLNTEVELSGYYGYDAQWFPIDKKWEFRLVLFDLVNNVPVAEKICKKEDSKTVKKFIENSIPPHKRKAIVTDLKKDYDKIMRDLGFDHQHCTFHLRLNINEQIRKHLKQKETKIKAEYKKQNSRASKYEIKKFCDKKTENLKNEINDFKDLFFELFNQQTYTKALKFIDLLKNEMKNFPQPLKTYLTKNFFPEYKKFLLFLKKDHKAKLTQTNNQTENYIGNIMSKSLKRTFRTEIGFFSYIIHRINGWLKNRKKPHTS